MSKEKDTDIFTQNGKSVTSWDSAISDAESQIQESQAKIKRLKRVVRRFRAFRDNGEPFFGQESKQSEVKTNVAQK